MLTASPEQKALLAGIGLIVLVVLGVMWWAAVFDPFDLKWQDTMRARRDPRRRTKPLAFWKKVEAVYRRGEQIRKSKAA